MKTQYGPYSPSRLDVATCPYRFKVQYIDKSVVDEGSPQSRRGNVVHEIFEEMTKAWLKEKELTWDEISDLLAQKMAKYHVTDESDQRVCIEATRKFMTNKPPNLSPATTLGTEEHLALKWKDTTLVECGWEDPEAYVRCKIDLLQINSDNEATIIDHKTQLHIEKEANTFQMGFYAWAVKKFYPYVTSVSTILHYCHPSMNFYSKPYHWSVEDLTTMEDEIKIKIKTAELREEFPEIAGHHCTYCPVKLDCPKLDKLSKVRSKLGKKGPLITAKQAIEQAEAITVLDESRKEILDSLKGFVKEIGPVQIEGLEYGFRTSEGYDVQNNNKTELFKILGDFGLDPWEFIDFDTSKMKKNLWRVLPSDKLDTIKKHLSETRSSRFSGHKTK